MEVIEHLKLSPSPPAGCVITVGNFDGVHRGHRSVIQSMRSYADRIHAHTAVVTFEPHTMEVVRPKEAPQRLTDPARKIELLRETGLDYLMVLDFDESRVLQPPEDFVDEVLVGCLRARAVMTGRDFRFGHGAKGDISLLREIGREAGFATVPLDLVTDTEGVFSSTAIRAAVRDGNMERAAAGLGRSHELRGEVIVGDQRGQTLGYPTANVALSQRACIPPVGVYVGRVRVLGGEKWEDNWHDAVVNLGVRPTFRVPTQASGKENEVRPIIEAHLLDFSGDLYGKIVDIGFVKKMRDEKRFENTQALVTQIAADAEEAKKYLLSQIQQ